MLRICLISGDHPRHAYLAHNLANAGLLVGWVKQARESLAVPKVEHTVASPKLSRLVKRHFDERRRVEECFFGITSPRVATKVVSRKEINEYSVINFIKGLNCDLVLSFGCGKIEQAARDFLGSRFLNIHGGLSPYYRGVITHFWPSYFLEPQMTGLTLHDTSNFLDAGDILYQQAANLVRGDGILELSSRATRDFIDAVVVYFVALSDREIPLGVPQKDQGRLFLHSDWRPEHLLLIYEFFDNKIVDLYLNDEFKKTVPTLINVFEKTE